MNHELLIPIDAANACLDDDAAIIIVETPRGMPPQKWWEWAERSAMPDVVAVEPFTDCGRQLVRITLGGLLTNRGQAPKEFRIAPNAAPSPAPATASVTISVEETGCWREPMRTTTSGSLPPSAAASSVEAPRCTKPVRVWPVTHAKLKAYAQRTGLEIAQIVGIAVDALPRA